MGHKTCPREKAAAAPRADGAPAVGTGISHSPWETVGPDCSLLKHHTLSAILRKLTGRSRKVGDFGIRRTWGGGAGEEEASSPERRPANHTRLMDPRALGDGKGCKN